MPRRSSTSSAAAVAGGRGRLTVGELAAMHRSLYSRLPVRAVRQLQMEAPSMARADAGIAHPAYHTLQARLQTFLRWPHYHDHAYTLATPFTLALEGFFQLPASVADPTMDDDLVTCFACGSHLVRWEAHDHPHHEHVRLHAAGGRCPLLHLREAAGVQPCMLALERGVVRTSSTSPTGASEPSLTPAQLESNPLGLPVPFSQLQAIVYSTPASSSHTPSSQPPSTAASAYTPYSFDLPAASSASTTPLPLSAFDRVRHKHLKRMRSVWNERTEAPASDESGRPTKLVRSSPSPPPPSASSSGLLSAGLVRAMFVQELTTELFAL